MGIKLIIFFVISGISAIKKPIYGGLSGMFAAPAIFYIFHSFDLPTILVLSGFGFPIGFLWGVMVWNLCHGKEYNRQNEKTYVMPISHRGTGQRGGIIYTDEEVKNARENENFR